MSSTTPFLLGNTNNDFLIHRSTHSLFLFNCPWIDSWTLLLITAGLVALYQNAPGVKSATAFMDGAPFMGGNVFDIVVEVCEEYPLVTIASMAINTNDCFVAMNGVAVFPGMVGLFDGLDAGSEENNEDCASIPGPACAMNTGNVRSGNGEGFVHVHRGMHDLNPETIPAVEYDWRNPMMRVDVSSMM